MCRGRCSRRHYRSSRLNMPLPRSLTKSDWLDAIDHLWIEMQGHTPSDLYEDGYSDACESFRKVVRRLFALGETQRPV